jgi:hypothetical protein
MSQIATELGLGLPLGLTHPWVLNLARKGAAPVSFSDLLGRTGRFDGTVTTGAISHARSIDWTNGSAPFFDSSLQEVAWNSSTAVTLFTWSTPTYWNSNILLKNNTTGVSAVLTPAGASQWVNSACDANNLIRNGASDNFTITPST